MSLKGLRILNTRPQHQAHDLTKIIQEANGIAIELPTLNIEPLPLDWLQHIPKLSDIQLAIFVSTNAVNYFFQGLNTASINWPKTITALAIGNSTAAALSQFHQGTIITPALADSEHLLQLDILGQVSNQSILFVSGTKSRTLIANHLIKKGARVNMIAVYKRTMPEKNLEKTRVLWQEDAVDIILLFSQQAIVNLFDLFEKEAHAWIRSKPCIVISDRLAKIAGHFGIREITVTSYDNLLTTLASMNHDPGQ